MPTLPLISNAGDPISQDKEPKKKNVAQEKGSYLWKEIWMLTNRLQRMNLGNNVYGSILVPILLGLT